ncbi:MAG: pirin family protein, partial [Frankiales bacterium]|nr:pirin family protein [Frankiales bacterium]
IVLEGRVEVDGVAVVPGQLGYLGLGRSELGLVAAEPSRVMVLGGVPFPEPVLMWWNYVARTREEIDTAAQDWNAHSDRFGEVASSLTRIESPTPLWAASR